MKRWLPGLAAAALLWGPALAETRAMLLEIVVNGHDRHVVAAVEMREDALWIRADDLSAAGIKVTAAGLYVPLAALTGVGARVDAQSQSLVITADAECLVPQRFDLSPERHIATTPSGTGFIGEYDLAAMIGDVAQPFREASGGAGFTATLFSPGGTFASDGAATFSPGMQRFVRFETSAEFDDPDALTRALLGDAVTGALDWSRPVRFAGLQLASDFTLRPDLVTFPMPGFFGESAVPSTLDVFVNAARVFETDVEAGPFQLDNIPVLTGQGDATVVLRDALGRETTATLPFFASDALLRPGLTSYDLDIGVVRRDFGLESFDYGEAIASGTWRRGLTDALTVEAHGEASRDVQEAGLGAALGLGRFGVLQAAGALSTRGGRDQGALYAVSFDTELRPFGFFGSVAVASKDYADLAAIDDGTPPPKLQLHIGANANFGRVGSFGVSWIELHPNEGRDASRLIAASYSRTLAEGWYLGATGFYDMTRRAWTGEAFLSVSLDGRNLAHAAVRNGAEEVGYARPVDPDGGFGYQLLAQTGDATIGEADATWITDRGRFDAGVSSLDGTVAVRALASGAVVAMDGGVYATQVPSGAIAVVHAGAPDVPVYRENRAVARTDADGDALVTGLVPYAENRVSVDPADYAFSSVMGETQKTVVPPRGSGVSVDLRPKAHHPAIVVLHLASGAPPPVGARAMLDDDAAPLVVGHDGEIFLAEFVHAEQGTVDLGKGQCRFAVLPPAPGDGIPRIGPVICR